MLLYADQVRSLAVKLRQKKRTIDCRINVGVFIFC